MTLDGAYQIIGFDPLSPLTTDQADVADDENLYDVLASHVQISSTYLLAQDCAHRPPDLSRPLDDFPGAFKTDSNYDHAKRCEDMFETHSFSTVSDQ